MVPVVMVGVSVHQEFQASQVVLDPRDHPVIMDLKDAWAHGERKAMKEFVEDREHQASKELKDLQAQQVHVGKKVKQVQLVPLETRVIQVLEEVKVPQVQRVLQDRLLVIGNSAFLRRKIIGTPD